MPQRMRMLILTGLFPNAHGNQSMLNSMRGYEREYNLLLITAADLAVTSYLPKGEVERSLARTRILSLWPSSAMVTRRVVTRMIQQLRRPAVVSDTLATGDSLSNTSVSLGTRLAFLLRAVLLAVSGVFAVATYRPSAVCIYEINGMLAAWAIRKLFPRQYVFGKFQGTVLGPNLAEADFFGACRSRHALDASAMRYVKALDDAIMTNDGTSGQAVLERYGFPRDRILFIPNGVDERFLVGNRRVSTDLDSPPGRPFRTISVSRLIGWKRVDRIIEAYGILRKRGVRNVHHTVIGVGTEQQEAAIDNLIRQYGAQKWIDFIGRQNIEDVVQYIKEADLLISVYRETNITNPVFEALAMGVPVLTIQQNELLSVLGPRAEGCFFIEEPGSESLPEILADFLEDLKCEEITRKKTYLSTLTPQSWAERSRVEREYILRGR